MSLIFLVVMGMVTFSIIRQNNLMSDDSLMVADDESKLGTLGEVVEDLEKLAGVDDTSVPESSVNTTDIKTTTSESSPVVKTETKVDTTPAPDPVANSYTLADIAKHSSENDCYTAINNDVYNVTAYFGRHPGGDRNLLKVCGVDATSAFNRQHGSSKKVNNVLAGFEIGILVN